MTWTDVYLFCALIFVVLPVGFAIWAAFAFSIKEAIDELPNAKSRHS